jgi:hypothetical protein
MAGDRRLSPAELKARLQANLAVGGVKSSNPGPVSEAPTGEKPQIAPEAPGSPPDASEPFSAPEQLPKALKATPSEPDTPKSNENRVPDSQTEPRFGAGSSAEVASPAEAPLAPQTLAAETEPRAGDHGPTQTILDHQAKTLPVARAEPVTTSWSSPLGHEGVTPEPVPATPAPSTQHSSGTNAPGSTSNNTPSNAAHNTSNNAPHNASHDTPNNNREAAPVSSVPRPTVPQQSVAKSTTAPAVTEGMSTQSKSSSILQPRPNEAKSLSSPPQTVTESAFQTGAQNPNGAGVVGESNRQLEAPNATAQTAEMRIEVAPAPAATPARKRTATPAPSVAKRADRAVLHRRDQGAVLRGYRIPVDLHRQAERAKLGLASRRGSSMFWDELLQGAIDLLLDDTHRISAELSAARRSPEMGTPNTRVLQAAIRHDQDLRLRMLRIDLEEIDGATVRLEEIWTWLIRQVVKNEG